MKGLFDLNSPEFQEFFWSSCSYEGYKGRIINGAKVSSVSGGFGDMIFQKISVPLFDLWINDYMPLSNFEAHARAPYRSIELSFVVSGAIQQRSLPFGQNIWKTNDFNLIHSLAMDSKVKFVKDMQYKSLDIHYSANSLMKLMPFFPHLIEPFLNEYEANRQMQLFTDGIEPNSCVLNSLNNLVDYVFNPDMNLNILQSFGLLLLINVFLFKREISSRRGLNKLDAGVLNTVNEVRNSLLSSVDFFKKTKYYANRLACMNETDFRAYFKGLFDMSAFSYWRRAKLDNALYSLLNTDKPIKTITLDAGYESPKAFAKEFKKFYEVSPSKYRKLMGSISGIDL